MLDHDGGQPFPVSLLREGAAMAGALAADFLAIGGVEVSAVLDHRLPGSILRGSRITTAADAGQVRRAAETLAAEADWTVVIAPEFTGHLLRWRELVEAAGGRVLGPATATVRLCSDKQATAEHLAAAGISTPQGQMVRPGDSWPTNVPYPAVFKPRDGAGSQGIRLLHDSQGIQDLNVSEDMRVEEFCPGTAASVAFLCGPAGNVALAPCRQRLSDDGRFCYLGGSLPLPAELAHRATALAGRAVATLPDALGYVGVDLVLGDDPSGKLDVVIEINPRLTTSYVGLRAAARQNLAAAMIDVAEGRSAELSFRVEPIEFDADGTLRPRE